MPIQSQSLFHLLIDFGSPRSPKRVNTGSPGINVSKRKANKLTPIKVGTAISNLLTKFELASACFLRALIQIVNQKTFQLIKD